MKARVENLAKEMQRRHQVSIEVKQRISNVVEECRQLTGGRPTSREIARRVASNPVSVGKYLKELGLDCIPVSVGRALENTSRRPPGVTARMIVEAVNKSVAATGHRPSKQDLARQFDIGEHSVVFHLRRCGLMEIPARPPTRRPQPQSEQTTAGAIIVAAPQLDRSAEPAGE